MQKRSITFFGLLVILVSVLQAPLLLVAQDTSLAKTPSEQRELFMFCDKAQLMNQLKISSETADRIADIQYWAAMAKLSVAANTNDTFAVPKEVDDAMVKKLKNLHLSGDQIKTLGDFNQQRMSSPPPCPIVTLQYNKKCDTMPAPRALQQYKTAFRKMLIDKTTINGRQADMVFETEVWKQKEAVTIAAIPATDFNRVRKTVALNQERERRLRVIGLNDQQIEATIDFFNTHAL